MKSMILKDSSFFMRPQTKCFPNSDCFKHKILKNCRTSTIAVLQFLRGSLKMIIITVQAYCITSVTINLELFFVNTILCVFRWLSLVILENTYNYLLKFRYLHIFKNIGVYIPFINNYPFSLCCNALK